MRLRGVDFDGVGLLGLPVRAEDDDGFRLHDVEDLGADGAELRVHGVVRVVHYVGAAVGKEVDGRAGHGWIGVWWAGKGLDGVEVFDQGLEGVVVEFHEGGAEG